MRRSVIIASFFTLLLTAGLLAAAPNEPRFYAGQLGELAELYGELNGDSDVFVSFAGLRGLSLATDMQGFARVNLLDGTGEVHLEGVTEAVDVYMVDNIPADGSSLLMEGHDNILFLGSFATDGSVRFDLGEKTRGFEPDRFFVVPAGAEPVGAPFFLQGSRRTYERHFTQQRLAAEGFELPARPLRSTLEAKNAATAIDATAGFGLATQADEILVKLGLVSKSVFTGGIVFFHETFKGNGRSCGTCHPPENNQVVGPRFIQDLAANGKCDFNDPNPTGVCAIFIAEMRFNVNGPSDPISDLEKPTLMRDNGLIMENVDGLQPNKNPSVNPNFMMRSVPHSLSLATSLLRPVTFPDGTVDGFAEATGWSADGAPNADAGLDPNGTGSFRDFLTGAIMQHYPAVDLTPPARGPGDDFRLADDDELDAVDAFLKDTARVVDVDINSYSFNNGLADGGRGGFGAGNCNACHGNAGANAGFSGDNRSFDTGVERLPNPNRNTIDPKTGYPFDFPFDCGNGGQPEFAAMTPNFDMDGDGVNDCFGNGLFNTPPLIEAADTGPWFHSNLGVKAGTDFSQPTPLSQVISGPDQQIEDAIRFYNSFEFNTSPASVATGFNFAIPEGGINAIGAFFRSVNAAFNINQCLVRVEAAAEITSTPVNSTAAARTANKLASLCNDEIEDAIEVLTGGPAGNLDPGGVIDALEVSQKNNNAVLSATKSDQRSEMLKASFNALLEARKALGTGLEQIEIGPGTLLF